MWWHSETGTRILQIFILMIFKVVGISSLGSDSMVTMTGTGLGSETPTTGTEAGGGAGRVAV